MKKEEVVKIIASARRKIKNLESRHTLDMSYTIEDMEKDLLIYRNKDSHTEDEYLDALAGLRTLNNHLDFVLSEEREGQKVDKIMDEWKEERRTRESPEEILENQLYWKEYFGLTEEEFQEKIK